MWTALLAVTFICLSVVDANKSEKSQIVLRVNATSSDRGKSASMVFDGNDNSCFSTDSSLGAAKRHEIEIQLSKKLQISKIRVMLEPNIAYNFTVFVENNSDRQLCHSVSTAELSQKHGISEFSCVTRLFEPRPKLTYDKIRLSDNYNSGKFTVCEVNVVVSDRSWCCDTLSIPSNLIATPNQTDEYPLIYELKCENNYILDGANIVRCAKDGKWDNKLPICIANTTTMLNDPPIKSLECDSKSVIIDQKTGYVTFTDNSTKVGSKAILHCTQGYRPAGKNFTECWPNGIWSHVGNYDFLCKFIKCPNVFSITNGLLQVSHPKDSSSQLLVGTVASVHCNNQFQQEVILRFCGDSGQWVPKDKQSDKYAQSDLDTVCIPKNNNPNQKGMTWNPYIVVSVITLVAVAVATAVVISVITCRRKRRPTRHYNSPPSIIHSLPDSTRLGYQLQPFPENEYNSIVYDEPYQMNNFNSPGNISDNFRPVNRIRDYDDSIKSTKPEYAENIYSEPLDSKMNNIDNVIYT